MSNTTLSNLVVAIALSALGTGAQAASSWSVNLGVCDGYSQQQTSTTYTAATADCSHASSGLQSVTGVGTNSYASGSAFYLKDVDFWSGGGVGVEPLGGAEPSPEHSVDNNEFIDGVLLKFDSSVVLNSVTFGWRQNDWDFSLFRYTGGNAPASSMYDESNGANGGTTSLSLNGTLGGGWELVANYGADGGCTNSCGDDITIGGLNAGNLSGSWWLVSAYSANYGARTHGHGGIGEGARDYFKLLNVAGHRPSTEVAEPGSLALAAIALAGLGWRRRRKHG